MRAIAVVPLLAGLALLLPPGASAAKRNCATAKGTTYLASSRARAFQRKNADGVSVSYACLLPRGRVWKLSRYDDFDAGEYLQPVVLAGRFVAFADTGCDGPFGEYCGARVKVRDLRNGKVVRSARAFGGRVDTFEVTSLVAAPNGDVAWIAYSEDLDSEEDLFQVRAATTAKGSRALDSANDIGRASLARAGNRVYWTRGGEAKSARLR